MSISDKVNPVAAASTPRKIVFDDPHALAGPVEAEITRLRRLDGLWRWLLIAATAATILLCVNQQFTLRFLVGYTQLNTEYFYLLIALMLPFTFLIFPGTERAPLDRIPWYDLLLFVAAVAPTSIQRQAPRRVRTRVTSASCMLAAAPCGSSNTIRLASFCEAVEVEEDIIDPARGLLNAD